MTDRSYKYPKEFHGFHVHSVGKDFGNPGKQSYSENFKDYLNKQELKH